MTSQELQKKIEGKTGRIYVARKGTVTIYEMSDGNTYMINNQYGGTGMQNPAEAYWSKSID